MHQTILCDIKALEITDFFSYQQKIDAEYSFGYLLNNKNKQGFYVPTPLSSSQAFGDNNTMLIELTSDHLPFLEQVAGNDRVHSFGAQSVTDLLEYRIGGENFAKTAFALVSAATNKLHSVIFGYKPQTAVADPSDIPGRVDEILKLPSTKKMIGKPAAMVFYSISAFDRGAGPALIQALLARNPDYLPATLSPLRTLRPSYPDIQAHLLSDTGKKMLAALHLMTVTDPVQKFHMSNGAMIGDIKVNANTPESEDGQNGLGIMVSYIYPRDPNLRMENKTIFSGILNGDIDPHHIVSSLMDPTLRTSITGKQSVAITAALCARMGRTAAERLICR